MPDDRHFLAAPFRCKDPRKQSPQYLRADPGLVGAIRQVAVIAVDIAERRRLDHHHRDGRILGYLDGVGHELRFRYARSVVVPVVMPTVVPVVPPAVAPTAIAPAAVTPTT